MGPLGYTDSQCGWFSFGVTIAQIVAGMVNGQLADNFFRHRFKRMLVITLSISLLGFAYFTLSLPSALWGGDSGNPPLPSSTGWLFFALLLGGGFLGASSPLFYELSLELTYPLPEVYSAGMMCLLNNIGAMLFLFIPPSVHDSMNLVMTLVMVMTLCLVSVITETYNRG
jgi:hypothetical protein